MILTNKLVVTIVLLVANFVFIRCVSTEYYFGSVEQDQLVFVTVRIPKGAIRVNLEIFADDANFRPSVLLRYNGVPTIDRHDDIFLLPEAPLSLTITDESPTESELYIGIWGGSLLHSFRYFAGSPSRVLIGMSAEVYLCNSEIQRGAHCEITLESIPSSTIRFPTDLLTTGPTNVEGKEVRVRCPYQAKKQVAINLPNGLEAAVVTTSLADNIPNLCVAYRSKAIARNVTVAMDFFLNQAGEDSDSISRSVDVDVASLCDDGTSNERPPGVPSVLPRNFTFTVSRPQPGMWTLAVRIFDQNANAAKSVLLQKPRENSASRKTIATRSSDSLRASLRHHFRPEEETEAEAAAAAASAVVTSVSNGFSSVRVNSLRSAPGSSARSLSSSASASYDSESSASGVLTTIVRRPPPSDGSDPTGNKNDMFFNVDVSVFMVTCPAGFTGYSDVFKVVKNTKSSNSLRSSSTGEVPSISNESTSTSTSTKATDAYAVCTTPITEISSMRSSKAAHGSLALVSKRAELRERWHQPMADARSTDGSVGFNTLNYVFAPNLTVDLGTMTISEREQADEVPRLPYAMFLARLQHTQFTPIIGGGMQIQLRVSPPRRRNTTDEQIAREIADQVASSQSVEAIENARETWRKRITEEHFIVTVRCRGLAGDPAAHTTPIDRSSQIRRSKSTSKKAKETGVHVSGLETVSRDALMLSTRDAVVLPMDPGDLGADEILGGVIFVWTVLKPAIPGLVSSGMVPGGAGGDIYFRVSPSHYSSLPYSVGANTGGSTTTKIKRDYPIDFDVSLNVLFMPCPRGACVHGTCEVQNGDIPVSSCVCKYPYAGERCSQLSVPFWFFVIQVLCLVFSNLAMVPGVWLCISMQLPVLAALLSSSAVSSAIYHLCDTDVYCLGGLSFKSLQIFDILFSAICMVSVILYHAPVSAELHASFIVLSVGLLISPVSNDPTNPKNMIFALLVSAAMCLGSWLLASNKVFSHRFKRLHVTRSSVRDGRVSPVYMNVAANDVDNENIAVDDFEASSHSDYSTLEMQTFRGTESGTGGGGPTGGDGRNSRSTRKRRSSSASSSEDGHGFPPRRGIGIGGGDASISTSSSAQDNDDAISVDPFARPSDIRRSMYEDVTNCIRSLPESLRTLWLSVLGLLLAILGILCFVLQTRESYWYMHSFWHIFVMSSSYPLVKGRLKFVQLVAKGFHLSWKSRGRQKASSSSSSAEAIIASFEEEEVEVQGPAPAEGDRNTADADVDPTDQ